MNQSENNTYRAVATSEGGSNIPEFSVGDLAFSLKKSIEDGYGHVRVRGELSRVSIAASGHMYSSLKDDNAVIDAVCWKGVMNRLAVKPEEGLEVICTGKVTTYPKSSKYQLVIESMELAGEGALLKMLEERKKKLAAEGLFDPDRKKEIPFLPRTIGVVTSPTGAVIRDILHRLRDRFPCHVILWPTTVQGEGSAEKIAAGIEGLQNLPTPPDTIIVARGGGSLEDLMPFNEEIVVRAAANCTLPLISAVGHETDTTLIDYAADLRAPTPTGAAEMAVPVRTNLMAQILDNQQRLLGTITRNLDERQNHLNLQAQALGQPDTLLEIKTQSLDRATDQLRHNAQNIITRAAQNSLEISSRLKHPRDLINAKTQSFDRWSDQLAAIPAKLFDAPANKLDHFTHMLEAYSFQKTLKRGFALIRDEDGKPVTKASQTKDGQTIQIELQDDTVGATIGKAPRQKPKKPAKRKSHNDDRQNSLF